MRIVIEFDTDNGAFEDEYEIRYVLDDARQFIENANGQMQQFILRDSNGNKIGFVKSKRHRR